MTSTATNRGGRAVHTAALRSYGDAIRLWLAGFDTFAIGQRLGLPEPQIERWVWNFRDMSRET